MAKIITQHRRGTTAEWEAAGVTPLNGEIIIVSDENGQRRLKIGDGTTPFNNLPFIDENLSDIVQALDAQLQAAIQGPNPGTPEQDPDTGITTYTWEQEVHNMRVHINGTEFLTAGQALRQTQTDLKNLENSLSEFKNSKNVDGLEYDTKTYELYLTSHGNKIGLPVTIVGGNGTGTGGSQSTISYENLTVNDNGELIRNISTTLGHNVILTFKATSVDDSNSSTGNLTCEIRIDEQPRDIIKNVPNGSPYSVDVTKYIHDGDNIVDLVLSDMYGTSKTLRYTVVRDNITLSTTYSCFTVQSTNFDLYYVVKGDLSKTIHFWLKSPNSTEFIEQVDLQQYEGDGSLPAEKYQTIPVSRLSSGVYTLRIQAIGAENPDIKSAPLDLELMIDKGDKLPMLVSSCETTSTTQGNPITISYMLYHPTASENTCDVELAVYTDSTKTTMYGEPKTAQVTRGIITNWPIRDYPAGSDVCFVMSYYDSLTGNLVARTSETVYVIERTLDVKPESDPVIYLTSKNKNNSASDKDQWSCQYKQNKIETTFEKFNWVSNGWIPDYNNNTALRLTGDAKATINYEPFYSLNTELLSHGFTFEIDFAVRNLNNRDCTIVNICDESTKNVVETQNYEYIASTSEYSIVDATTKAETENIFIIYDNGWFYREGVEGVPKPLPASTSDTLDSNGLGGTHVIDDITTLVITPQQAGSNKGTITVTQTTTVPQIIGIKMTPDTAILGTSLRELRCNYKDEERIRLSFTIDSMTNESSKFMSCYVNGVLSGVVNYTGSDNFNNNMKIVLGSENKCTLDVYCVRLYNKCLSARSVLYNYIYDHSDSRVQDDTLADNDIYTTGGLSYQKIVEKMPVIIFTGVMPKSKGDKKIVKMDFINPLNNHVRDFSKVYGDGDPSFKGIDVEIDVQGTSSQYYVRKNWKVKLKKKGKNEGDPPIFDHPAYQHMEDEIPAKVFCIKVDYAEGTGTHNTQNANFAETLYDEKVPAQYDNSEVRTTVAGFPCVIFERETETSPLVFSSKGNFNFDKDAEEAFGFTDDYDVECWEFGNNIHGTTKFTKALVDTEWTDNFEARCFYPKYFNYQSLGYTSLSKLHDNVMKEIEELGDLKVRTEEQKHRFDLLRRGVIQRFKRMHDWVVSTKNDIDKFKAEFEKHFNLEYCLIYYVYTLFALMTDQRAKNMFLTYWGRRIYVNETTGTWMIDNIDTNIYKDRPAPTPELDEDDGIEYFTVNGEKIIAGYWYPYLYDNDTCFGINNSGNISFDYYHEDTDTWDNGQRFVYNGQESVLWINFKQAFESEIEDRYKKLRSDGVLTEEKLYKQFIDNGSEYWNASIYNEDAEYKYLSMARPGGNGLNDQGKPNPPNYANLYQVKGDGTQHFKYFVKNRLNYCDSKWKANDFIEDKITLRIYNNEAITLKPFSSMYCGVEFGADKGINQLHTLRTFANEPQTFRYLSDRYTIEDDGYWYNHGVKTNELALKDGLTRENYAIGEDGYWYLNGVLTNYNAESDTINDLEVAIFGASQLSSVGDLSHVNTRLFTCKNPTKLTELKLGDTLRPNTVLKELSLTQLPLLRTLDVTNCRELASDLNLSTCYNIEKVYAFSSKISGVTLPRGGYIDTVYLPTTVTQMYLISQHDLELAHSGIDYGLAIGQTNGLNSSMLNIEKLVVADCPNIDVDELFAKCLASGKLQRVHITGVDWHVDDWKILRSYYMPKQSEIATDLTDTTKPYFIQENAEGIKTYVKRGYQGNPDIDTGIEAFDEHGEPQYGYGLKGLTIKISTGEDGTDQYEALDEDKINIHGKCTIHQDISGKHIAELKKYFSDNLIFCTDAEHTISSTVYFRNNEDTETIVAKEVTGHGAEDMSCTDLTDEELALFTRSPSYKYDFTFTMEHHGWSYNSDSSLGDNYLPIRNEKNNDALVNILGDRYLYPVFHAIPRSYPVKFYNDDNSLIEETTVPFGQVAVCSCVPTTTRYENSDLHPFARWVIYKDGQTVTDLIVNEDTMEYDEITNTGIVNVYAVYYAIDEQYEIPQEGELAIEIDQNIIEKFHIKGRESTWYDEPNVFVEITDPMNVRGAARSPISITGFDNFGELQLIKLPDSITQYVSQQSGGTVVGAFENCSSLAEFTINKDVKSLGTRTFANCSKLSKIYYNASNANELTVQHKPFLNVGRRAENLSLHIGNNVSNVPAHFFYTNNEEEPEIINQIVWGDDVQCTRIGEGAFRYVNVDSSVVEGHSYDPAFTTFEVPGSIISIGQQAFENSIMNKGTPVNLIISGPTVLGDNAFAGCSGVEKVTLAHAECSLTNNPFANNPNLKTIECNATKYSVKDNLLLDTNNQVVCSTNMVTSIPTYVKTIGSAAFLGNASLSTLTIDESHELTTINSAAFKTCNNLVAVDLSSSKITTLASSAFYKCAKLETVVLPKTINTLETFVLYDCPIKTITIPENITVIQPSALRYGTDLNRAVLEEVFIEGSTRWNVYNSSGQLVVSNLDLSDSAKAAKYLTCRTSENGYGDHKFVRV